MPGYVVPSNTVPAVVAVEHNLSGSGSPNILTALESGLTLSNVGAAAKCYNTLPPAVPGLTFNFYCADTDGIRITAGTGDTIRLAANVSAAAGYAESTTIGSYLQLDCLNAAEWVAKIITGTWTVT